MAARSLTVIMVVSWLQLAYCFAPGSRMPLAQSRGHSMSLRPTMALQAAPSAAVLLKTAPAVVQASILVHLCIHVPTALPYLPVSLCLPFSLSPLSLSLPCPYSPFLLPSLPLPLPLPLSLPLPPPLYLSPSSFIFSCTFPLNFYFSCTVSLLPARYAASDTIVQKHIDDGHLDGGFCGPFSSNTEDWPSSGRQMLFPVTLTPITHFPLTFS